MRAAAARFIGAVHELDNAWELTAAMPPDDIRALCAVESEGVVGSIAGRAIYDGSLDFQAAQALADELSPQTGR